MEQIISYFRGNCKKLLTEIITVKNNFLTKEHIINGWNYYIKNSKNLQKLAGIDDITENIVLIDKKLYENYLFRYFSAFTNLLMKQPLDANSMQLSLSNIGKDQEDSLLITFFYFNRRIVLIEGKCNSDMVNIVKIAYNINKTQQFIDIIFSSIERNKILELFILIFIVMY